MDEVVFREFYVELAPVIASMAARHIGWPDGEDLVSDVFLVALRRWDQVPTEPTARRAWLCTVAHYKIAEEIRRRQRGRALQAKAENEWWREEELGLDPADAVAQSEAAAQAFASLSPADQEIINLIGCWGLTPQQAADALGCSLSAAATRTSRARARLTAALERSGAERQVTRD